MEEIGMKVITGILLTLFLASMLTLAFNIIPVKASSTIIVPDHYANIQWAIGNATAGDTIFVRSGTYYEKVVVDKSLTLVGEDRDTTIVDGGGSGNVVDVTADNVSIKSFTIRNGGGAYFDSGILLRRSNDATISNNNIMNCHDGIHLFPSSRNNISFNNLANHEFGIFLNSIAIGTLVIGSSNNTLKNNSVTNSLTGILVTDSHNNTIRYNNIRKNSRGISLLGSSNNTAAGNNVTNNGYGIELYHSSSNVIIHNNFINNTKQVYSWDKESINTWDNGYPSSGNYWSDYTGVDLFSGSYRNEAGSDGIGDTPYVINGTNKDNYPLMGTFSDFTVSWENETYHVAMICNSTISNFEFNASQKMICFNVSGEVGVGFCRVSIPTALIQDLWEGNYTVLVDGQSPLLIRNWPTDGTNNYIYFTYIQTTHKVTIVPEFPSATILLLSLTVLIVTIVCFTKREFELKVESTCHT